MEHKANKSGTVFGGVLLVGGTCIGAGMLGLPAVTAAAGFVPTMVMFLLVWFFMTCSALAYLEISLRFKGDVNMISMAGRTLGFWGKSAAWVIYILFLYSLMAAYTAGGTSMFLESLSLVPDTRFKQGLMSLLFTFPFALMVYYGAAWVDRLNRLLMAGLILSFIYMGIAFSNVSTSHSFNFMGEAKYLWFTLPILVTSFGYHLLIPTLKSYCHENPNLLRKIIIFGGLLPLVVYGLWETIVFYLLPADSLINMLNGSVNPGEAMAQAISVYGKALHYCVVLFTFFALTSSFLGVGLGIFDFFSDGLHVKKNHFGKIILTILTFGPPVAYTVILPGGFIMALSYAGVFAAILLIVYPILMAWNGRYINKLPGDTQLPGGRMLLIATLIFGVLVMCSDLLTKLQFLPLP